MLTEYEQNYSSYEQNNIDIDDFCTIVNGSVFMFFSCFSPIYSTQLLLSKTRFCRGATICWTSRNSSLTPGRQRCRTRFFKSLFLCKSQRFPQNMMDFKWLNHKSLYIYICNISICTAYTHHITPITHPSQGQINMSKVTTNGRSRPAKGQTATCDFKQASIYLPIHLSVYLPILTVLAEYVVFTLFSALKK